MNSDKRDGDTRMSRKAAEDRAMLATIVENSSDAIISRAMDGTILSWNAAAERLLGYTAAEAVGRNLTRIVPPERRKELAANRVLIDRGEVVPSYETARITKDGRQIEVSASVSPMKNEDGKVIGLAAIVRDISRQKELEREVQRKIALTQLLEALARAANEAATPEDAMRTCLARICEYGNWAIGRLGIYAAGENERFPEHSLWHTHDSTRFAEFIAASLDSRYFSPTGRFMTVVVREKTPVWRDDLADIAGFGRGAAAAACGLRSAFAFPVIVRDQVVAFMEFFGLESRRPDAMLLETSINIGAQLARLIERRRAEEALKHRGEELQRFRAAMDATSDAIYLVDRATMKFIDVNEAACRMRGQTREEILAFGPHGVLSQSREELERAYDAVIAGGGNSEPIEVTRQGMDGSQVTIELERSAQHTERGWIVITVARDITERKQAERALRESEETHRAIFEGAHDGILVADAETRKFITANPAICGMLGYAQEEMTRIGVSNIHRKQDLPRILKAFESILRGETRMDENVPILRKDGSVFYADIRAAPIRLGGKERLLGIFRDVTERRAAEAKIQRLTQLYAALSQCNQAIVRCKSEEELFPTICRDAVKFGGMKMAWIGLIEPVTRMIRSAANFGDGADEYLQGMEISVDPDSPLGRGPSATAVCENRPVWMQDFQSTALTATWHERRARLGWGAAAILPLHRNSVPIGVLCLYAAEVNAFDEAVRRLLIEMATDIGFALDNYEREAARERAQQELRAAEEQFRGLVEQSIAGIYIIQDGKYVYGNPRMAEILGYASFEELKDRDSMSTVAEKDRAMVAEKNRLRLEGDLSSVSYSFTAVRKDGSLIEAGVHGSRATHKGRPAIIGLAQDISEKRHTEERIQRYIDQLKTAFMSTVEVATSLSELRDPYTAGHERRVGKIAAAIGTEMGLDEQRIEGLRVAGFLHDIGKITIPAEILSKPGKLTPLEYQIIQAHPRAGYDVLKDVEFPWPVAAITLQHHERFDGSGYPQGLEGETIMLEARIMAVADVMEAMSSHRPYRPGLGIDKALAEIERGRGTAYDPVVAEACLRLFREKRYELPA